MPYNLIMMRWTAVSVALMAACSGSGGRPGGPPASAITGAVVSGPGTSSLPLYRLVAELDPTTRRLVGRARVRFRHDPKQPLRLLLHPSLRLTGARLDGRPVAANPTSATPPPYLRSVRAYRVEDRGRFGELELSYEGTLPARIGEVNRVGPELVELAVYAAWYPIIPELRRFAVELEARLPPGYRTFSSRGPGNDVVLLASRRFETLGSGALELVHAGLPRPLALRLLGFARRVQAGFVASFGRAPGGAATRLRLVLSPRGGWGYGRAGLVVLSGDEARAGADDEGALRRTVHFIAHEVSHQWWDLADTSTKHDWINEALAEYSALRASAALFGPLETAVWRTRYLDHLADRRPPTAIVDTSSESPFRYVSWYERGALLFDALEHEVGRADLDRCLARLSARRGREPLTTTELRRRLAAQLGDDAHRIADRWLYARTPTARWIARQRALSTARARRLNELNFITDKLERVYSHLEAKQKRHRFRYRAVKARAAERVRRATSDTEHRAALAALLAAFHDGHLKLVLPGDAPRPRGPAVTHRWLPGKILLTRIARLFGDQRGIRRELRRGLALLRRARGLIIDLRGNPGGNNSTSFDYVARLFDQPITIGRSSVRLSPDLLARRPHYHDIYPPDPARPGFARWREAIIEPRTREGFAGPVAVLIDHGCYSSCESTALALKQSGRARLYGQATGGGSANPITFDLPYTRGKLMVPTWIFIKPGGEPLEDNGIKPHVVLDVGENPLARAAKQMRAGAAR